MGAKLRFRSWCARGFRRDRGQRKRFTGSRDQGPICDDLGHRARREPERLEQGRPLHGTRQADQRRFAIRPEGRNCRRYGQLRVDPDERDNGGRQRHSEAAWGNDHLQGQWPPRNQPAYPCGRWNRSLRRRSRHDDRWARKLADQHLQAAPAIACVSGVCEIRVRHLLRVARAAGPCRRRGGLGERVRISDGERPPIRVSRNRRIRPSRRTMGLAHAQRIGAAPELSRSQFRRRSQNRGARRCPSTRVPTLDCVSRSEGAVHVV
jgi:hypothetical protein